MAFYTTLGVGVGVALTLLSQKLWKIGIGHSLLGVQLMISIQNSKKHMMQ